MRSLSTREAPASRRLAEVYQLGVSGEGATRQLIGTSSITDSCRQKAIQSQSVPTDWRFAPDNIILPNMMVGMA